MLDEDGQQALGFNLGEPPPRQLAQAGGDAGAAHLLRCPEEVGVLLEAAHEGREAVPGVDCAG